ncbi:PAAR domain-containing protein [Acinetobacter dispersus]|uniref:PAAR domain-containing protein n=1 Tax=Acinetobacter dispersus TaxID=70348 RepID=UPI001F4B814C|nr:PAAR domain-containing protein [Acinetobacter dispersus]MCH7385585.1 PAAR domain-containing protein [Acinetobacter dispersus]
MATSYITIGCPTTGGGKVLTGNSLFQIEGVPIACTGDQATCPKHKVLATIITGDPHMNIFGKLAARVGDSLSCGCKLLPKQNLVVQDNGASVRSITSKNTRSLITESQTNNFYEDKGKYENYYIERQKTEYIKFKTFVTPYDEDRKSAKGVMSQVLSGTADFVLDYDLTGKKLFISVSMIPPRLKNDATIFPFGTINLYHEGQKINQSTLKVGGGFWDTSRDKQPVGSCTIELPEPNLQPVTVELTAGYRAKFDVGLIIPMPPTTTFKFDLNSATRRVK